MKERKNNPDKIGFVKFWGWQTRGVAASVILLCWGIFRFSVRMRLE